MNDTLFPEYLIEELRQTAGILSGPLKIAGQIILRPDFEKIEASIKNDQLHLSESRALSRNRGFQNSGAQKHPSAQLVVAFFIARHFYDNCYGDILGKYFLKNRILGTAGPNK